MNSILLGKSICAREERRGERNWERVSKRRLSPIEMWGAENLDMVRKEKWEWGFVKWLVSALFSCS